jgi:hypothetical protein
MEVACLAENAAIWIALVSAFAGLVLGMYAMRCLR